MAAMNDYCLPLDNPDILSIGITGGKAMVLAELNAGGFPVPPGFVVTTAAYRLFMDINRLDDLLMFELGRKPFSEMRWEEIWDAALRIRSAFLRAEIPDEILDCTMKSVASLGDYTEFGVRSSSPKEDREHASFAGLHDSIIGVSREHIPEAVKKVWASLWSDAALLYQNELGLEPLKSSMAVVIQPVIRKDISGVSFGLDPAAPGENRSVIETVPGLCENLVDGSVEPERWIIQRTDGKVLNRPKPEEKGSLLMSPSDVTDVFRLSKRIESHFRWIPDMEWTGSTGDLTVLQARPVTTAPEKSALDGSDKAYYLSLRPAWKKLKKLKEKVHGELIPMLEKEGRQISSYDCLDLNNSELADRLEMVFERLEYWEKIYDEYFIPFAHGARTFGQFYNDLVKPEDPFEFVSLLTGQRLLSTERNSTIQSLVDILRKNEPLREKLKDLLEDEMDIQTMKNFLKDVHGIDSFMDGFIGLLEGGLDVALRGENISDDVSGNLKLLVSMSENTERHEGLLDTGGVSRKELENRFFSTAESAGVEGAEEVLEIGKISWKLRDDDNILLGRIENAFLRMLGEGEARLRNEGRCTGDRSAGREDASEIIETLRDPRGGILGLSEKSSEQRGVSSESDPATRPRQLTGQPASPGLASGRARVIENAGSIRNFEPGEVLVCDAIDPRMTHVVPLSSAIVERRGGMLIHGAIIAREMGIPCVNGVPDAALLISTGDYVTVDGFLGIVTIGKPDFGLELGKE